MSTIIKIHFKKTNIMDNMQHIVPFLRTTLNARKIMQEKRKVQKMDACNSRKLGGIPIRKQIVTKLFARHESTRGKET
jgi:hypothetical protein